MVERKPRASFPLPFLSTLQEEGAAAARLLPPPPRLSPVINQQIDSLFHPVAEAQRDPMLRALVYIADGAAHAAVELADQLVASAWKFAKYNLPRIIGGKR